MNGINTQKLIKIRKSKGFTIHDMSKMLGISPSFYCQLETGKRNLYYKMAVKIARIFELKPDDLFYVD